MDEIMGGDEKSAKTVPVDTNAMEEKNVRKENEEEEKKKKKKKKEDKEDEEQEEENSKSDENVEPQENSEQLAEGEFEVNQIRDVAAIDGQVKYLVSWKDYGSDQDSWEPEEYLESARLLVTKYNASHPYKVNKARQLVEAQKKMLMKKEKMRKRMSTNSGNDSSEKSEVTNRSSTLRSSKRLKVSSGNEMKENGSENDEESDDQNDRDEDYRPSSQSREEFVTRGSKRRSKRVVTRQQAAKKEEEKSTSTDSLKVTRKKVRDSWLYEEGDSDTTSGSNEKSHVKGKTGKTVTEEGKQSSVTIRDHASSESDAKNLLDKKKQDKVAKESVQKAQAKESMQKPQAPVATSGLGLPEPKVEFTGIVQCIDGTIKALYNKKNEERIHVVSIKEAYELDSSGLIQYFINRCEFGEPQSSKK